MDCKFKFALCGTAAALVFSCSFNYGGQVDESGSFPEITLEDFEYVRVKGGDVSARLKARIADRYESRHVMEIKDYQFEQYDAETSDIDALGDGGAASLDLSNNNAKMREGIRIRVNSEDFNMETSSLDWQDKPKILQSGKTDTVRITSGEGTDVTGTDFYADVMSRTWVFGSDVGGVYHYEDEEEENKENSKEPGAEP